MNLELEKNIIQCLPYESPFLFVKGLETIDENRIKGYCSFQKDDLMLQGHFKGNPVIPGVILLEVMGQIGMVCHFIYLSKLYKVPKLFYPILANLEADFLQRANTDEKLIVSGSKIYLRNNILKSEVDLQNKNGEVLARSKIIAKFIYD